jgi:hypothetical protein
MMWHLFPFVVFGYITEVEFLLINLFFCSFQYILVSLLPWWIAVVSFPEAGTVSVSPQKQFITNLMLQRI